MKRSDNIRCIREYKKKDGSITYHAEVRRKRAKTLRKACKTLTEAKNWVRSIESAILEGKLPQETKARKYTVNDLIEQYETIYLSRFPKRIRSQVHHLAWWREYYGHKLLSDITPSLLAQAKHSLLSETTIRKTPRSGPTVNRYFATLSKAFSLASSEWEWIKENPVRRVGKLPENKGRTRFLSKEELQAFLQACKEHKNRNLYGMVLMAASLGMRYGEIARLKWKNVDFEHRLITLEVTKNHDIRVLPMPDQIYSFLKSWNSSNQDEDYLFPSQNPSKRPTLHHDSKSLSGSIKTIGIKGYRFPLIKAYSSFASRHVWSYSRGINGGAWPSLARDDKKICPLQ